MQNSDWDEYKELVVLHRNVTVAGGNSSAREPESWPVLDMGYVAQKVRLANGISLTFSQLVVANPRWLSQNIAPGFDILAPSVSGDTGFLILRDSMMLFRIGYPLPNIIQAMAAAQRPTAFPGQQQYTIPFPQDGCIPVNRTDPATALDDAGVVHPARQCWATWGRFTDVGLYGADMVASAWAVVPNNYIILLRDADLCCRSVLPKSCVKQFGPVTCWRNWLLGTLSNSTLDQGDGSGRVVGGGHELGIILGCVLGGLTLAALAAVGWVLARRRRHGAGICQDRSARGLEAEAADSVIEGPAKPPTGTSAEPLAFVAQLSREMSGVERPDSRQEETLSACVGPTDGMHLSAGETRLACSALDSRVSMQLPPPDRPSADPWVVVSPLTPPCQHVRLNIQLDNEVKLLPRVLGKGSFGKVVEGEYQGQRVAVKMMLQDTLGALGLAGGQKAGPHLAGGPAAGDADAAAAAAAADGNEDSQQAGMREFLLDCLVQEVEVLGRCCHPNVVRLLAACLTPPQMCLVMELMDTSLDRLLYGKREELLPLDTVLSLAVDVARGLEYLHPTIVHRDLKPGNVLIKFAPGSRIVAKLSDFGLSRLRATTVVTTAPDAGTPEFMAPELFDLQDVLTTHKSDMFSFGVLLWSMLTGRRPWQGEAMLTVAMRSVQGQRPPLCAIPAGRRVVKLTQLLVQCWEHDPQRRPAAAEVVKRLMVLQEQMALELRKAST